jgi:ribonuclease HI
MTATEPAKLKRKHNSGIALSAFAVHNGSMKASMKHVDVFTDGACLGNPGPGGYGVILKHAGAIKELSAGYRMTTNNRMELLAVIRGLEALTEPCEVSLYSDSQYVVNAIEKGWVRSWRASGWRRKDGQPVLNIDLWQALGVQLERHNVRFFWVRGHAGHPENERCDQLAVAAAKRPDKLVDSGYETTARPLLK